MTVTASYPQYMSGVVPTYHDSPSSPPWAAPCVMQSRARSQPACLLSRFRRGCTRTLVATRIAREARRLRVSYSSHIGFPTLIPPRLDEVCQWACAVY
ncbi:hypothetical protein L227DRAFT_655527 [Lentinus tigrinus ALCF2SS1-6]|uniref:Uncharacterized protein n=1 Tax=Lentinus tigrinus ALCF2SS1-6 TaxID=1328759 RepID=A0A5C2S7R1_9APHY|nr:hypothetical protein L227DRAFT_655527 [Lentinus tigrinus ALCF2SS1-6]